MSRVIRRRWISDLSAPSRRGNRSCEYEAYVPDALVGRAIALDGDVAADIADAEAAIARLNVQTASLLDTEALARILLRAESVASSKIEGLQVGARRLLRAQVARELGASSVDITATEILRNIDAMTFAVQSIGEGDPITQDLVCEVHRRLLAGSRIEDHGGRFREVQNWIGGSDFHPCDAAFVPPPPEIVGELVGDLVVFCNEDSLPATAQAAIAHAQFETIHPFIDGNGRTGRALIHLILRRRGIVQRVLPPVSLILATWARDYIGGLVATRYRGPASGRAAHDAVNLWVALFAGACKRAVDDAWSFEHRTLELETDWRARLGSVRARSAVDLLVRTLPGAPIVTVNSAAAMIDRSYGQTSEAVTRLVEAGILKQVTAGRRNRAFEAPEVIAAFTALERRLASPEGDTHVSPPARMVPKRQ